MLVSGPGRHYEHPPPHPHHYSHSGTQTIIKDNSQNSFPNTEHHIHPPLPRLMRTHEQPYTLPSHTISNPILTEENRKKRISRHRRTASNNESQQSQRMSTTTPKRSAVSTLFKASGSIFRKTLLIQPDASKMPFGSPTRTPTAAATTSPLYNENYNTQKTMSEYQIMLSGHQKMQ